MATPGRTRAQIGIARRRAHPRSFDVLLARKLAKEDGLSYNEIARRLGVSNFTIRRAVDLRQNLKARRIQLAWIRQGVCECGAPKSRNAKHCRPCATRLKITTVRPAELLCTTCRQWKLDSAFAKSGRDQHRRGRRYRCRSCERDVASGGLSYRDTLQRLRERREREAAGDFGED